jgi:hypothetical protein
MQTIDEAKERCRFVSQGIEKMVADGEDPGARFEGTQIIRFKVDKVGNYEKVVGGEMEGDVSQVFISESGVTKEYMGQIVGHPFDAEIRSALVEFFTTCYYA